MDFIRVIGAFCEGTTADCADVLGRRNNISLWDIRYMSWHYMHYSMGFSANRIAKIFNRDRVNIFRGIRLLRHRLKYHGDLKERYYNICAKIESATEAAPPEDI